MPKIPLSHANIIQILGIESLPLDQRKEIVDQAINLVETEAFNRVMEKLDEENRQNLVSALENQDDDSVAEIFTNNGINLVEITEKETEKVKQDLARVSRS